MTEIITLKTVIDRDKVKSEVVMAMRLSFKAVFRSVDVDHAEHLANIKFVSIL